MPKTVGLMRCLSCQLDGHRSGERDSHKTCEFSARKSCVKKRMRIRDEPSGGSHQTVVFSESEKTYELMEHRRACRCRLSLMLGVDLRSSSG